MIFAAVEYQKLLDYYKQESYRALRSGYRINLVLLYLFIGGFFTALVDSILREPDILYTILAVIFHLGAVYVLFTVRTQAQAALMLREKALEVTRAFVDAIDLKDFCTRAHSKHVYDIVGLFYDQLKEFKHVLNKGKLLDAALFHDIGKINISAEIFRKQEKLTGEEWALIKTHPAVGKEMLDQTCFSEISDWIMYHHERVDGNGYYGRISEEIPLESKIIAIADVYSALCNDRSYRPRLSHDEAVAIITKEAGKQFDPVLVERFLQIDRKILEKL
ncbi:HD domain-containing protein [Treponema sp. TIM-1]|uniref:HD-GYP domain-containing protein n=1 Tax=Treponema sp. TIM-1 TaxID=2898417 RepID=UPI00397F8ACF